MIGQEVKDYEYDIQYEYKKGGAMIKQTFIDNINIIEGISITRYRMEGWCGGAGYHIRVEYKDKPRTKEFFYLTKDALIRGLQELILEYENKGFKILENDYNFAENL